MRYYALVLVALLLVWPSESSALPHLAGLPNAISPTATTHHDVFWYRDRRYRRTWRRGQRWRHRRLGVPPRVLGWRRVYIYRYRGPYRPSVMGWRRYRYDPVARYNGYQ